MLCAPYKDPQDPLKFLEALDTDMIHSECESGRRGRSCESCCDG